MFAVNVLCGENHCDEYDECLVSVLAVRGSMPGDGVWGGESRSVHACVYVCVYAKWGRCGRVHVESM